MNTQKHVSIIGAGKCSPNTALMAEELGYLLAQNGYVLVCGGLGGVMEAAAKGAKRANGLTIGILPGNDPKDANPHIDIPIVTGLGPMRNYLVIANGQLTVAIEGGAGTLSEIGLAQKIGRKVIALGRWANLPQVISAVSPKQVIATITELMAGANCRGPKAPKISPSDK